MTVYRLDPKRPYDLSWQASRVKEPVWVSATIEDAAREKVARATLMAVRLPKGYPPITSPWLLANVTTCILDLSRTDIPRDKVVAADGRALPRSGG